MDGVLNIQADYIWESVDSWIKIFIFLSKITFSKEA
jgi:hypothetical protein